MKETLEDLLKDEGLSNSYATPYDLQKRNNSVRNEKFRKLAIANNKIVSEQNEIISDLLNVINASIRYAENECHASCGPQATCECGYVDFLFELEKINDIREVYRSE